MGCPHRKGSTLVNSQAFETGRIKLMGGLHKQDLYTKNFKKGNLWY